VLSLRLDEPGHTPEEAERTRDEATSYFDLAWSYAGGLPTPLLVLVMGVPASGKRRWPRGWPAGWGSFTSPLTRAGQPDAGRSGIAVAEMRVFLETERLVLRQFTEDDLDDLFDLDSDPDVMRFINGVRPSPLEDVLFKPSSLHSPPTLHSCHEVNIRVTKCKVGEHWRQAGCGQSRRVVSQSGAW
jgi:hypothetical protein